MNSATKKLCIVGTGGFGRETLLVILDSFKAIGQSINNSVFFLAENESSVGSTIMGVEVLSQSSFHPDHFEVVVAIGDPMKRKRIASEFPTDTVFRTVIHPSAVISEWVEIGPGSIICAGVVITCNVRVGNHAHLNLHSTIGHDCVIGDYFTTTPAVNISGDCKIGDCVYMGTNSSTKQGISICENVKIGMGSIVLHNITEPGTYFGNPLKLIFK